MTSDIANEVCQRFNMEDALKTKKFTAPGVHAGFPEEFCGFFFGGGGSDRGGGRSCCAGEWPPL